MGRQSKFEQHKDGVLVAIDTLTKREGKSPSMRMIATETGVSVATLHAYLKKMRAQGLIEWVEGKHRSLRLAPAALAAMGQGSTPPSPPATTVPAPVPPTPSQSAKPPTPVPFVPPVPVTFVPPTTSVPLPPRVDDTVDVGF